MFRLYDYLPSGNGYKVRLALTQLGFKFERIECDIIKGETRTPGFLSKNLNGRIPLLELDDGRFLAESNAILYYLAARSPLFPNTEFEQAQVLQWMFFEQYSHEPAIAVSRFVKQYLPADDPRHERLPELIPKGYAALDVMEQHLDGREFFVGNAYSIADIALYAYTHVANEGGFDLTPYRSIRRWLQRIAGQPNHIPITKP